ncbi:MAG: tRNA (guanosine(37)-N1)-methyltransferase TrmD [Eubacterium sp.]|nr:tRNA (guanosine(37)-N1)-methyltransferase TrmD [Eubacterium sp.]
MNYYVMTLFPEFITNAMNESIMGRAIKKNIISVEAVNIRDFAQNSYRQVDDYIYGGGSGMLMQAEPVWLAYQNIIKRTGTKNTRVLYMSPQGRTFNQSYAQALSKNENIIFLCGHYEGIDERVIEMINPCEVSLGDFVLTGGELPAMTIMDAVTRLIPGVLGHDDSSLYETFYNDLLEYPQYTRPPVFEGRAVPQELLSGNHKLIEKWRLEQSIERTRKRRPDLYEKYMNSQKH